MTNKTISVAEAKKRLSELLGRVAYAGESFVIARRGRPVAQLVPLAAPQRDLQSVEGWLRDDDPFFAIVERIVEERSRHVPRVGRARKPRR